MMDIVTYHIGGNEFTIARDAILATGVNLLTLQLIRDNTPEVKINGTVTHVYLNQPPELFPLIFDFINRRFTSKNPENEMINTSSLNEEERQWVEEGVYDFLGMTPSVFDEINRMHI